MGSEVPVRVGVSTLEGVLLQKQVVALAPFKVGTEGQSVRIDDVCMLQTGVLFMSDAFQQPQRFLVKSRVQFTSHSRVVGF